MVKKCTNDGFLSSVSKLSQKFNESKQIRITIKRNIFEKFPQLHKVMKHHQKNDLMNQIKSNMETDTQSIAPLIVRVGNNSKEKIKFTTEVNESQVNKFSNQLSNILRLFCFNQKGDNKGLKKQIRKSTPADPKSKKQIKLKEKKRRNKERRQKRSQLQCIKKRESQRQKTYASRQQKLTA